MHLSLLGHLNRDNSINCTLDIHSTIGATSTASGQGIPYHILPPPRGSTCPGSLLPTCWQTPVHHYIPSIYPSTSQISLLKQPKHSANLRDGEKLPRRVGAKTDWSGQEVEYRTRRSGMQLRASRAELHK